MRKTEKKVASLVSKERESSTGLLLKLPLYLKHLKFFINATIILLLFQVI